MPGNLIQPYVDPPLPMWRPDAWAQRDYWVEPPKVIPPNPAPPKVPAGDEIAFGEAPREMSAYQERPTGFFPFQSTVSSSPQPQSTQPQWQAYTNWNPREYAANQQWLAPLLFPKPPPPYSDPVFPQWQERWFEPWKNRDYESYQSVMASLLPVLSRFVPAGEEIVFGELPKDYKIYQFPLIPKQYITGQNISLVVPAAKQFVFGYGARDMTALRIANEPRGVAFSGIPIVPLYESYTAIEEEPRDMAPFMRALTVNSLPPVPVPYLYPTPPPPILPPPWNFSQYPSIQDNFSAIAPPGNTFPVGLQPLFTLEALIREIPRPQNLPLTFILPPKPPRVFPVPPTFLEWRDWAPRDYDSQQAYSAPWIIQIPIPAGFLVMAVVAGVYQNVYRQPGDVFMLNSAADYSAFNVNYGPNANTPQYGWMMAVAAGTSLITQSSVNFQPIPLEPVLNPVPPNRTVY